MGNERKVEPIRFVYADNDRRGANITLPESLWKSLDEIAEKETRKKQKAGHKGQVSRNHVIENALGFFVTMYNQKEGR